MVIVTASGEQSIVIIPRAEPSGSVFLFIKSKTQNRVIATVSPATSYSNGKLTLTWTPGVATAFTNEEYYQLELTESGTLLWRGTAYCTAQTDFPDYSVATGKFTEYTGNNNEFLTI